MIELRKRASGCVYFAIDLHGLPGDRFVVVQPLGDGRAIRQDQGKRFQGELLLRGMFARVFLRGDGQEAELAVG